MTAKASEQPTKPKLTEEDLTALTEILPIMREALRRYAKAHPAPHKNVKEANDETAA